MQSPTLRPHFFLRHKRQLRALLLDNQPWFVARDLGRLINRPIERQINRSLDDDQLRTELVIDAQGHAEEVLLISESGAYIVLLNCFHPENRCIRRWISNEVVPSLRDRQAPVAGLPLHCHWQWSGSELDVLQWQGRTWVPFVELPKLVSSQRASLDV